MKDTDADVRDLRRMLAVPDERDFPPGQMRQREEHMVDSLTEMSQKAESRRRRTLARRWVLAGTGLAAVAGVAAIVLAPSSEPAYAVTANSDGTVTITVNNIGDPADANRELKKAGVQASVMLPKAAGDCPERDRAGVTVVSFQQSNFATDLVKAPQYLEVVDSTSRNNEVRIRPNAIPEGKLVIVSPIPSPGGPMIQVAVAPESGTKCIVSFVDSWYSNPASVTPTPVGPAPSETEGPRSERRQQDRNQTSSVNPTR
jgi:hypothetical protein